MGDVALFLGRPLACRPRVKFRRPEMWLRPLQIEIASPLTLKADLDCFSVKQKKIKETQTEKSKTDYLIKLLIKLREGYFKRSCDKNI